MRGFGIFGDQNTLILVDGQRISENEQIPADLASIPLSSIERIEILRGSGRCCMEAARPAAPSTSSRARLAECKGGRSQGRIRYLQHQ